LAANVHFLRKLASDELRDTLFFATGERVVKMKQSTHVDLHAGKFNVKIVTNRNITVNGDKCRSIPEAKYVIQQLIS
jgi:hypothetical protein